MIMLNIFHVSVCSFIYLFIYLFIYSFCHTGLIHYKNATLQDKNKKWRGNLNETAGAYMKLGFLAKNKDE